MSPFTKGKGQEIDAKVVLINKVRRKAGWGVRRVEPMEGRVKLGGFIEREDEKKILGDLLLKERQGPGTAIGYPAHFFKTPITVSGGCFSITSSRCIMKNSSVASQPAWR